ncbi:hypothetical protein [Mesorhizobium carmichaelinearum]|uniref:hypothetical protein n=1 Tax=Mesorhizobium carmichaelinearum TaxID=1208188 RepID=UPI001FCE308E|nr:hypothetical protein [Mesorhizobium carmichaelinearum]
MKLEVFKGARHAFASPGLKIGTEDYGDRVEYKAAAAEQSISDVQAFLRNAFDS